MSSGNTNLEALAQAWIALRNAIDSLPCEQQERVRRRVVELGAISQTNFDSPLSAEYARQTQRTFGVVTFGDFSLFPLALPQNTVKIRGRKGRELFCYLLNCGQSGVSKEQIIRELWFDSCSENIPAVVDVCIAHLRRDLAEHGLGSVIISKKRRYYIDASRFKCDFDSFRAACDSFLEKPTLVSALHIAELYQGDYMAGFDAVWAKHDRYRFRHVWKKALEYIEAPEPHPAKSLY